MMLSRGVVRGLKFLSCGFFKMILERSRIRRRLALRCWCICMTIGASSVAAQVQIPDPQLVNSETVVCSFKSDTLIAECISRMAPTIQWRSEFYASQISTFSIDVRYPNIKNADGTVRTSAGTGFLVNKEKRYVITAKHVLLGDRVDWPSRLPDHGFVDLESAIEDYLRAGNIEITGRLDGFNQGVRLTLVALDRTADLALLQATSFRDFGFIAEQPQFRALPMMDKFECAGVMPVGVGPGVFALGYPTPPPGARIEASKHEYAGCNVVPKTAYAGGLRFRFPLTDTKSDFEPGYSGGPVLDYSSLRVVGVVSGATVAAGSSRRFFTPLPAVKSFLSRF